MYDLSKKNIKNKKLLKESPSIARAFIKKLLKKFIKISLTIVPASKAFIEKLLK